MLISISKDTPPRGPLYGLRFPTMKIFFMHFAKCSWKSWTDLILANILINLLRSNTVQCEKWGLNWVQRPILYLKTYKILSKSFHFLESQVLQLQNGNNTYFAYLTFSLYQSNKIICENQFCIWPILNSDLVRVASIWLEKKGSTRGCNLRHLQGSQASYMCRLGQV